MTQTSLFRLSVNAIEHGSLPLKQLLTDSLYYPACDIDGEIIRYCNRHFGQMGICSFVYADYGTGEDRLIENLDGFLGYHLLATRNINPEEVGADQIPEIPQGVDMQNYLKYQEVWQRPFARWSVFERDGDRGDDHGPLRFSLLYLGSEGVATYAALYLRYNITPKAIALIQPGHAFGLNWTNFWNWDGPLASIVKRGKSMPEYFFYGGLGFHGYNCCPWWGYRQIDRVDHYYPNTFDSALTVWRGTIISLKVYDGNRAGNIGVTLQIMDVSRTLPHEHVNQVFVEYQGRRFEATIGTYRRGNTLRGAGTIKELILANQWAPGRLLPSVLVVNHDTHCYLIIEC